MVKRIFALILFCLILVLPSVFFSQTSQIHHTRRQQILHTMPQNSVMILQTPTRGHRFGYGFQQDSDLYYLTGLNTSGIILILSKNGISIPEKQAPIHEILVTEPVGLSLAMRADYYRATEDSLRYDLVCGRKDLRKILDQTHPLETLYTEVISTNQKEGASILEKRLIELADKSPNLAILSPSALTAPLRRVKDELELSAMQRAIDITLDAQREAFKSMAPGLYEYQIEAVIEYIFKFNGSHQLAFDTIIGAGPNSLDLHYSDGLRKMQSGDMVVMDIGCEYQHYCADITRTIPTNGIFTPEQKEIYTIVLECQQAVIAMLKPGVTLAQMDSTVIAVATKHGFEKYIRHGCTHYLGLDVHDVGDTRQPLEPGCVVTVEPGLYIPPKSDLPEAYWNIGVRIEDDVLITADGSRVLSGALMKNIEDIEKFMKQDGLAQRLSK
ncbi:MAG: aminopeptidase P N-terminal domain-containing protein [Candidatus Zhuqueibacterota bacterium]